MLITKLAIERLRLIANRDRQFLLDIADYLEHQRSDINPEAGTKVLYDLGHRKVEAIVLHVTDKRVTIKDSTFNRVRHVKRSSLEFI